MEETLNPVEIRILGALIEKELTTPEYYPLTLNALKAAANQKSNRDPVMRLDETTILRGLDHLRQIKLAWQVSTVGSRAAKFEHRIDALGDISAQEIAVLAVLMLRGPQTAGEIRTRSARMYEFESPAEVLGVLNGLAAHDDGPFTVELPLQPGRREPRFAHLLAGEPQLENTPILSETTPTVPVENERLEVLEQQVATLQNELRVLWQEFAAFKREFE